MIKHLPANTQGRDFIVGDIHGCLTDFNAALKAVDFNPAVDRVISVGDLIDRGPDSVGCIGLLDNPWFYAVRGNHEQMMIDVVVNQQHDLALRWIKNGGDWALDVADIDRLCLAERLNDLPYALIVGEGKRRFNVLHAEFFGRDSDLDKAVEKGFDEVQLESLLWGREIADKGAFEPDKEQYGLSTTYCGHTIVDKPFRRGSHVFVDTGAVRPFVKGPDYPGYITLLEHGRDRSLSFAPQESAAPGL